MAMFLLICVMSRQLGLEDVGIKVIKIGDCERPVLWNRRKSNSLRSVDF